MPNGTAAKRASSGKNPNPKRPRTKAPSKAPTTLKFKSPAEFFAENKNIAGFDNPGKSLYTTIRELVENGLDAAEAVGTLPDIEVTVERIGQQRFRSMVGMDGDRERVDASLYKDVENTKERKAREAKERREAKRKQKLAGGNGGTLDDPIEKSFPALSSQEPSQQQEKKGRAGGNEIFRVNVSDNGSGMPHVDVPNMMGRVLAGTKYCVQQARGKFGLGSKMALIWSKMSTGLPVEIHTSKAGEPITHCILDIDIAKNVPNIIKHDLVPKKQAWRGTKVSVTIQGNWSTYRAKILLYMRQMAVITPYAQFRLKYVSATDGNAGKDFELVFSRRTDKMPPPAREVKHHPSSVNQLILKQLIGGAKASTTLLSFLTREFESISRKLGTRLIVELGDEFTNLTPVKTLTLNHIRQIDALLHEARFDKPDGSCLSPAGEYNLRLGISKELKPTLVATHAEAADVFEGHPFIVEAGVALGGSGMKPGINVYRFANRIPLLFEAGNDVVSKTARDSIRWNNYKISPTTDRIGVICSIVSTKIPFKGTGKEYIGDDSESIKACVKRAITQCCIQLKTKLVRRAAQKNAAERKKMITRYAPDVVNAIVGLFNVLDDGGEDTRDVREGIQTGEVKKEDLLGKLLEHVQQFDKEQAIEYATATGRDDKTLETVFLAARAGHDEYISIGDASSKMSGEDGCEHGGMQLALLESGQSEV